MFDLTIKQMLQQYSDHKLSPVDVTQQCLNDISRTNAVSNAFITVCTEQALNQARAAEYRYSLGLQTGLLEGIPVSIKDMIDTAGVTTTYGSSIDRNHIPENDAAVVTLLRQQGAVNLGKNKSSRICIRYHVRKFILRIGYESLEPRACRRRIERWLGSGNSGWHRVIVDRN